MGTIDTNRLTVNDDVAIDSKRLLKLSDLITFGKIGIKIVFTLKKAELVDRTAESEADFDTQVTGCFVWYGECSGETETDWAGMSIWLNMKMRGITITKHFGFRF